MPNCLGSDVLQFFSHVSSNGHGPPYCWSVTALLTIWPWVQGSFESFWWWGRTNGQRQFIPVANGLRKEGVFIDIGAAWKLDKGKTVFIHLPCKPRVLVQLIRTNRVQTVDWLIHSCASLLKKCPRSEVSVHLWPLSMTTFERQSSVETLPLPTQGRVFSYILDCI